jgi:hypothetical protein
MGQFNNYLWTLERHMTQKRGIVWHFDGVWNTKEAC